MIEEADDEEETGETMVSCFNDEEEAHPKNDDNRSLANFNNLPDLEAQSVTSGLSF